MARNVRRFFRCLIKGDYICHNDWLLCVNYNGSMADRSQRSMSNMFKSTARKAISSLIFDERCSYLYHPYQL